MKKLHFSITIDAPAQKVWNTMLGDVTYREWTKPFNEGGYYKGSWEKGSKILFVGLDPNTGKESGMVSQIAENRPNEFISIEHMGIIKDGIEDTTSEEAKKWAPAFENYTLSENDGKTTVMIDIDILQEHEDIFNGMWPKALEKLKEISER